MTCEEFNRLTTEQQPELVYFLDGYNRKDGSSLVDLDRGVGGYENTCRASPRESVWSAIRPTLLKS